METEHIKMLKIRDELRAGPQVTVLTPKKPFLDLTRVDPSVVGLIERVKQKRDALFEKRW